MPVCNVQPPHAREKACTDGQGTLMSGIGGLNFTTVAVIYAFSGSAVVNGLMEQRRPPCVILQYPFAHSLHTWLVGARGSLFLVDSARRRLLHRARKRERRLLVRSVAAARAAEAVRTTGHDKSHGDDDDDQPPRVPRLADLQREALDVWDFAAHRVPEHEAPDMWDFAAHHLRAEVRRREVRLRQLDERTADVGRSAGRNAQQACRRSACNPLSRLNPACVQQRVN